MGSQKQRRSITEAQAARQTRQAKAAARDYIAVKVSGEPERWCALIIRRNEAGEIVNLEPIREAGRPDRIYLQARRAALIREVDLMRAEEAAAYWRRRAQAAERAAAALEPLDLDESIDGSEEEGEGTYNQSARYRPQSAASA